VALIHIRCTRRRKNIQMQFKIEMANTTIMNETLFNRA